MLLPFVTLPELGDKFMLIEGAPCATDTTNRGANTIKPTDSIRINFFILTTIITYENA
jgi:hypothetical protein